MHATALIPQLETLRTRLTAPHLEGLPTTAEEAATYDPPATPFNADADLLLEQLPYAIGAAQTAIVDLVTRARRLLDRGRAQLGGSPTILIHTSEERDPLAWAVDAYFTAVRRAQNAVIPYLSNGLKKSMPSSLAEVAEKIAKGKTIADSELDQLVTEYWQEASGSRVKDYRDLAEHHAIISSDVRIVHSVTGEPLLVLCLPNNPETKSARELRFRDPIVHAIPFVIATFVDLLAFVSRVCDAMVAKLGGTRWQVTSYVFRGELSIGPGAVLYGDPVPQPCDLDQMLRTKFDEEISRLRAKT